ncbi:hypothetical protein QBE53_06510 [Vallitaleaceae bacterium 9-2]
MSEFIYKFIPMEVNHRFNVHKKEVIDFLDKHIERYDKVELHQYEQIEFIDCGQRFESVVCNHCHHSLLKTWGQLMNVSAQGNFKERSFITPCCGKKTQLDALIYYGDSGFARSSLEVLNPSIDIEDIEIHVFEKVFGCQYKCVISQI